MLLKDEEIPKLASWTSAREYAERSGHYPDKARRILYEGCRRGLLESKGGRREKATGPAPVRFRSVKP